MPTGMSCTVRADTGKSCSPSESSRLMRGRCTSPANEQGYCWNHQMIYPDAQRSHTEGVRCRKIRTVCCSNRTNSPLQSLRRFAIRASHPLFGPMRGRGASPSAIMSIRCARATRSGCRRAWSTIFEVPRTACLSQSSRQPGGPTLRSRRQRERTSLLNGTTGLSISSHGASGTSVARLPPRGLRVSSSVLPGQPQEAHRCPRHLCRCLQGRARPRRHGSHCVSCRILPILLRSMNSPRV